MPEHSLTAGDHVVIAGASGLIGRALAVSLERDGVRVTRLVRRTADTADEVTWDPGGAPLDPSTIAGARAVVGLNGASIGRLPWTSAYRSTLLWSRVAPVRTLADAVRRLGADAPQLVTASGVNAYGDCPGKRLDERSPRGDGFLARLVAAWENAVTSSGSEARTTQLRFAPAVHADGVLAPLMLLTRLGLAGPIAGGRRITPWVSLEDMIGAIRHVIDHGITGPVNITGPTPATQNDLGFALAMRMHRPFLVPAPAWALRAALGDAARDLLLSEIDAIPAVLEDTGYTFRHRTVEDAITAAIPAG